MEANEKLEGFLQELVPALDANTYEKWKGTNFQDTISDGNRFNFSSFLLKFTSYQYKRKVQLCSVFVHIKFFLKNTFCSNKVWSIKLQSAQAEGTEYKHIGKQSSK